MPQYLKNKKSEDGFKEKYEEKVREIEEMKDMYGNLLSGKTELHVTERDKMKHLYEQEIKLKDDKVQVLEEEMA